MRERTKETTLSNRIDELMVDREIKNADLAKALYVAPTTVSGYRNGYRCPDLDKINRMAEYMHVSKEYLLGFCQDPACTISDITRREQGILELFRALSHHNQELAQEQLTELLVNQTRFHKNNLKK